MPPTQNWPIAHALSHMPQWLLSLFVLTHSVPHIVENIEQAHVPPVQVPPKPHVLPQAPQFLASVSVFVQKNPQSI